MYVCGGCVCAQVCGRGFVSVNRRNQHAVCAHTAPARRCPLCPALFHLRSMVNTHVKKVPSLLSYRSTLLPPCSLTAPLSNCPTLLTPYSLTVPLSYRPTLLPSQSPTALLSYRQSPTVIVSYRPTLLPLHSPAALLSYRQIKSNHIKIIYNYYFTVLLPYRLTSLTESVKNPLDIDIHTHTRRRVYVHTYTAQYTHK